MGVNSFLIFHMVKSDGTQALAGELANTLVTRNSRATRTSKYLALQLRFTGKSARSRVQTPEYEFIVNREFKLSSTNLLRGLF